MRGESDGSPLEEPTALSEAYAACAASNLLLTPARHRGFRELEVRFATQAQAEVPVVTTDGDAVHFFPLCAELPPIASQSQAFHTLCDFWQSQARIAVLHVHLEGFTASNLLMQKTTSEDVARGIAIWSTLPCRIQRILVHEPVEPSATWRMGRLALGQFLPRKVRRKVVFQKPDGHLAEEGDPD